MQRVIVNGCANDALFNAERYQTDINQMTATAFRKKNKLVPPNKYICLIYLSL